LIGVGSRSSSARLSTSPTRSTKKPKDSEPPFDPNHHLRTGIGPRTELKPIRQINHGDDAAPQIEHARDVTARQRDRR
jgi:hypothetical protein